MNQLVWPETKRADDGDQARAREVLTNPAADDRISAEGERRLHVLTTATTRGDLYRTLRDSRAQRRPKVCRSPCAS